MTSASASVKSCLLSAQGCQKEIVKPITEQDADYVITLKKNQGGFYVFNAPAPRLVVRPVPEPLTILGSFVAFGFGIFFKRKTVK